MSTTNAPLDLDGAELVLHPAMGALDVSRHVILTMVPMQGHVAPQARLVCGRAAYDAHWPLVVLHPELLYQSTSSLKQVQSNKAQSLLGESIGEGFCRRLKR